MTITENPGRSDLLDLRTVDQPPDPPPGVRPPDAQPPTGTPAEPGRFSPARVSRNGWITAAIAAMATFLYTWSLTANGYANGYYAAAVKSGSVSWKAFFFGSIDSGSFITVDKPPAALWVQELSVRIFGFSSWSMLLPEAIMGVASVLILHKLVRTWQGDVAAHLAAAAFALTPVAIVMFRFNNPDALLTLLCLGAAWALWAALESGRTRGLILSAALMGLAFDTKMLQAFLVLPAFILCYLVAGKPRLRVRIAQLAAALGTLVVAAGWWVALVALWPAADRPFIGSTSDNSILSLIFGYNGLSRLFGGSGTAGGGGGGAPGGGAGGGMTGFGGAVSWLRMFNSEIGGQIAWFIPLALFGLVAGLWLTRRAPRTDLGRAGWILWGGWATVVFVVFSRAQGTFHAYYTVQLAPGVAAVAGAGAIALWKLGRTYRWMAWALPATIIATAALAVGLLDRTPTFVPWLRPVIIVGAVLAAVGLWLGSHLRQKPMVLAAAAIAVLTLFAGPAAYAVTTIRTPASGSIVLAGPVTSGVGGMGGGMGGGRSETVSASLISYLEANRGDATYLVAGFGSSSTEGIIIATGEPVITIGGFTGSDPSPTLAQFQALVASGQVRYLLVGGGGMGGGPMGGGSSSSISTWAAANGKAVAASEYGGSTSGTTGTLYDLSGIGS